MEQSNPQGDENINRKIINVLHTEIRRLSRKGQKVDFQPTRAHPQSSATPSAVAQNHKARLVSTSVRNVNSQYKTETIPTLNDQTTPSGDNSSGDASLTVGEVSNDIERELQEVAGIIKEASRIIIFGGAGMSTNCGIPVSIKILLVPVK